MSNPVVGYRLSRQYCDTNRIVSLQCNANVNRILEEIFTALLCLYMRLGLVCRLVVRTERHRILVANG